MGWGEQRMPVESAVTLQRLAAAVRRYLKHSTTGNRELLERAVKELER